MSDPRRLLFDADATDAEKALLESWKEEKPSAGARESTLAMLGIGGASIGAAAAGSSIAPKAITAWSALTVTKWLVIGALATGLLVTGVVAIHGSATPPAPAPRAPIAGPPVEPAPITMPAPVVSAPEAPPVAMTIPVAPAPSVTTKPLRAPRPSTRENSDLSEQIAALDRARAALTDGDPARSQQLVNDYEARFPNGSFVEEAEVLRVEALVRQGDRAGATRVGNRFLSAHPTSPHAARVRALLGSAGN